MSKSFLEGLLQDAAVSVTTEVKKRVSEAVVTSTRGTVLHEILHQAYGVSAPSGGPTGAATGAGSGSSDPNSVQGRMQDQAQDQMQSIAQSVDRARRPSAGFLDHTHTHTPAPAPTTLGKTVDEVLGNGTPGNSRALRNGALGGISLFDLTNAAEVGTSPSDSRANTSWGRPAPPSEYTRAAVSRPPVTTRSAGLKNGPSNFGFDTDSQESNEAAAAWCFLQNLAEDPTNLRQAVFAWSEKLLLAYCGSLKDFSDFAENYGSAPYSRVPVEVLTSVGEVFTFKSGWSITASKQEAEYKVSSSGVERRSEWSLEALRSRLQSRTYNAARTMFKGFHWNDEPTTALVTQMSCADLDTPVVLLGVCNGLQVFIGVEGSGGKMSPVNVDVEFPASCRLYALGDRTLVIRDASGSIESAIRRLGSESSLVHEVCLPPVFCPNYKKGAVLGHGVQVLYGARKDQQYQEYYHDLGETSHKFPHVVAVSRNVLAVYGGDMRIEDRGIVE